MIVTGHRYVKGIMRESGYVEHLGKFVCCDLPVGVARGTRAGATARCFDSVRVQNAKIRTVWSVKTDLGLVRTIRLDIEPIIALDIGLVDLFVAVFFVNQLEDERVAAQIVAKYILEQSPRIFLDRPIKI